MKKKMKKPDDDDCGIKMKRISINGKPSDYIVFSIGEIYSEKSHKFLKQHLDKHGYIRVKMTFNGRKDNRLVSVHRLVAEAFIPNPENKPEVNHKDGNKQNNDVLNLEWTTKLENIHHAVITGLMADRCSKRTGNNKLSDAQIHKICKMLEDGEYTINEIADYMNVSKDIIGHILYSSAHSNISKNYNISNYKKGSNRYTRDQYEEVFKLLAKNKMSYYDISDITKVSVLEIGKILRHYPGIKYSDFYNKYYIDDYTIRDKKYSKKITDEIIARYIELKDLGYKKREIASIISKEFDINIEYIYINLTRK